jgi:hypothetical protein
VQIRTRHQGVIITPVPLTIILDGGTAEVPATSLAAYTPVVGDTVFVDNVGGDLVVVDKFVNSSFGSVIPIGGCIWSIVTITDPSWLLCDGSTFSASAYPALNTLLGGDTLPNLVNYSPAGTGLVAAGSTTGSTTASTLIAHTHGGPSHTHTGPSHSHSHNHGSSSGGSFVVSGSGGSAFSSGSNYVQDTDTDTDATTGGTGATGSASGTTGSTGSGSSFSIQNPILGGYWYLRAQ